MKFSGLFEKLETLINLIIDSDILIILMLLIIAVFLLRLINKINNKKMGIFIYFIELIILGITFYEGKDFLIKVGNELIDNIFLNFYFPSIYIYLFIFVISFIIFIYTLLNRFISKTYKMITNTYFLIFNFIFILLLSVISENNINIFAKESLFTNNNALVLLELSTLLFFLYIVVNSLVYITNSIIMFVGDRKLSIPTEKYNNELEIINPETVELEENTQVDYSPKSSVSFQELVKSIGYSTENIEYNLETEDTKIDLVPEIKNLNTTEIEFAKDIEVFQETNKEFKFIDPILLEEPFGNEVIKLNEEDTLKEKLNFIDFNILEKTNEDKLTLKDYKLFSNMLKTVIENNNSANLGITDILNKNLLEKYSFEEYSKFEKILDSCLN